MEIEKGTQVLWFDAVAAIASGAVSSIGIPIRIGIRPLEEFVNFLAQLAVLPHADKVTLGEAYKRLSEQRNKWN